MYKILCFITVLDCMLLNLHCSTKLKLSNCDSCLAPPWLGLILPPVCDSTDDATDANNKVNTETWNMGLRAFNNYSISWHWGTFLSHSPQRSSPQGLDDSSHQPLLYFLSSNVQPQVLLPLFTRCRDSQYVHSRDEPENSLEQVEPMNSGPN